jgi:hypothetical protein
MTAFQREVTDAEDKLKRLYLLVEDGVTENGRRAVPIDVVEVDDAQIRIKGRKDVLERAVLASRNESMPGSQMSMEWHARRDSNS